MGHSFDVARTGYVNLILAGRIASRVKGDPAEMLVSRRRFLELGHYDFLSRKVAEVIERNGPAASTRTVVDLGAGCGYLTDRLASQLGDRYQVWGADVARHGIVTASKSRSARFVVASLHRLPALPESIDVLVSIMSPLDAVQFWRAAAPGSIAAIVRPGSEHLVELRRLIYGEKVRWSQSALDPLLARFDLIETHEVRKRLESLSEEQSSDLIKMTPFIWRRDTSEELNRVSLPHVTVHFQVHVLQKRGG